MIPFLFCLLFYNIPFPVAHITISLYYDSSTSFSKTKIQGNSRGERNEGKEEGKKRHHTVSVTDRVTAISHSFSPFSPGDFRFELQSLDATHSSNFSLPPFSRHSAFISSTLTDPSYERERFDHSYHSAYYLILKRPSLLPPVRHFAPKNVSSIAPFLPLRFAPGYYFIRRPLACPPSTLFQDVSSRISPAILSTKRRHGDRIPGFLLSTRESAGFQS